jgi:hypothetical protein
LREQRLLKHFQREARHDRADFRDSPGTPSAHALNGGPSNAVDGGREFRDLSRREQRRERAPLNAPLLAFGGQESVAESRPQDAKLKIILAVVGGVIEKHASDRRWVMRGSAQSEDGTANRNRPLEIALPPNFDRIALQGEEN